MAVDCLRRCGLAANTRPPEERRPGPLLVMAQRIFEISCSVLSADERRSPPGVGAGNSPNRPGGPGHRIRNGANESTLFGWVTADGCRRRASRLGFPRNLRALGLWIPCDRARANSSVEQHSCRGKVQHRDRRPCRNGGSFPAGPTRTWSCRLFPPDSAGAGGILRNVCGHLNWKPCLRTNSATFGGTTI